MTDGVGYQSTCILHRPLAGTRRVIPDHVCRWWSMFLKSSLDMHMQNGCCGGCGISINLRTEQDSVRHPPGGFFLMFVGDGPCFLKAPWTCSCTMGCR